MANFASIENRGSTRFPSFGGLPAALPMIRAVPCLGPQQQEPFSGRRLGTVPLLNGNNLQVALDISDRRIFDG
jgi:hypothetical protein